ncbi:hypothetical protein FGO68_gene10365 [Halteria grandinella]|uniref:Uncharacterized protein n=1 Tax=Halteria grandinella TaxID=5974 RepID=A0A8J8P071_HALGN|nr:hypothetical protein FGO68_gene10365 [Halteria grandinella]
MTKSGTGESNYHGDSEGKEEFSLMRTNLLIGTFIKLNLVLPMGLALTILQEILINEGHAYLGIVVILTLLVLSNVFKRFLEQGGSKQRFVETKGYFLFMFFVIALSIEWSISRRPGEYRVCPEIISYMAIIEHFETIVGPSMTKKTIQYLLLWAYYILRNYIQYGKF